MAAFESATNGRECSESLSVVGMGLEQCCVRVGGRGEIPEVHEQITGDQMERRVRRE